MPWSWEIMLIELDIRPFTFFMSCKILTCDFLRTFLSLLDCKWWAIKLLDCLSSEEFYWLKCEDWFYHFQVSHQLDILFFVAYYQHLLISTCRVPLLRKCKIMEGLYNIVSKKPIKVSQFIIYTFWSGVCLGWLFGTDFVLISFKRFLESQIPGTKLNLVLIWCVRDFFNWPEHVVVGNVLHCLWTWTYISFVLFQFALYSFMSVVCNYCGAIFTVFTELLWLFQN